MHTHRFRGQSPDRRKRTCLTDDLPGRSVGGDRESATAPKVKANHVYEVRPRYDKTRRRSDSDALPFDRLWYGEPNAISNAIGYATHRSRSHRAVIRVHDQAGNVIKTHKHAGDFREL